MAARRSARARASAARALSSASRDVARASTSVRLVERDPVWARIDDEQHRALRERIAFLVRGALQVAAHARLQLDRIDRFDGGR
ncbi:hypothetical protein WJ28_07895 [Burkholderia thailandensis]|nr:hypothetical protein WJ28_07895 [Burkholderia thailandensis]